MTDRQEDSVMALTSEQALGLDWKMETAQICRHTHTRLSPAPNAHPLDLRPLHGRPPAPGLPGQRIRISDKRGIKDSE